MIRCVKKLILVTAALYEHSLLKHGIQDITRCWTTLSPTAKYIRFITYDTYELLVLGRSENNLVNFEINGDHTATTSLKYTVWLWFSLFSIFLAGRKENYIWDRHQRFPCHFSIQVWLGKILHITQ